MKALPLLLILSALANGVLLYSLRRPAVRTPEATPVTAAADSADPLTTESTRASQTGFAPGGVTLPSTTRTPDLWSRLYGEDPDEMIARLKAAGFTFQEIRSVMFSILESRFAAARAAIRGSREDLPYWKNSFVSTLNPEQRVKEAELMKQQSAFYGKYFAGPDAIASDPELADQARNRFGELPVAKLQQLSVIQRDYDELQQEIFAEMQKRGPGGFTADERKKLSLLQDELQRDFQQALTPEEYYEYQLRSSPTAQRLRSQLGLLKPTEAEYKALFALQSSVDEKYSMRFGSPDDTARQAYATAIKNLQPQIQAALGPDRYADYQQLMQSGNDKVTRLMARLGLPLATAGQLETIRNETAQRLMAIRGDAQIPAAEKVGRINALATETEARLTTALGGARGLEAYADLKGDWLRGLRAQAAPR